MRSYSEMSTIYEKSVRKLIRSRMEAVNTEFTATAAQMEGKLKGLSAAFRKLVDHSTVSGNSR